MTVIRWLLSGWLTVSAAGLAAHAQSPYPQTPYPPSPYAPSPYAPEPAWPSPGPFPGSANMASGYLVPEYVASGYVGPKYVGPEYVGPEYVGPEYVGPRYGPVPSAGSLLPVAPMAQPSDMAPSGIIALPDESQVEAASAEEVLPSVEPEPEPEPKPKPAKRPWEGGFELGLDGSSGNSETFNFRLGFDAKRKTERNIIDLDLDYRRATNDNVETASRAFLDWRCERLFKESPWTCFVHGTVDYDEFKTFDARVTGDLGLGRQLIDTEWTQSSARFGAGFSREIDGPDDTYVPEAVFGLDFEHKLSDRQKLTASAEYTPDMTGFEDFRLKSRASWETLIDEEMNLSLKLSILDRYDSTPNGDKANDVDYSAVLLWKF